nr:MAG TPA: hypothetical protein [Caudoviricetes sp.]
MFNGFVVHRQQAGNFAFILRHALGANELNQQRIGCFFRGRMWINKSRHITSLTVGL